MIIHDLDCLESISEEIDVKGASIILPSIDLAGMVQAFSEPSRLLMDFSGSVKAGSVATMKVFSNVFVRAISPF